MSSKKRKEVIQDLESTDTSKRDIPFEFHVQCTQCKHTIHFHRGQDTKSCPVCGNNVTLNID